MRKTISNKALKGQTRTEVAYYAHHSAKRYAKRFTNNRRALIALRVHLRQQRREADGLGVPFHPACFRNWASLLARHLSKHNPERRKVEASWRRQEIARREREEATRQQHRTQGRSEYAQAIIEQPSAN